MLSSPSWNWLAPGPRRLSRWRLKSRTAILHIHKSVTARRQFHGRGGVASGQPEPPLVGAKRRTRVLVRGVRRSDAPACSPSGPGQDLGSLTPLQTPFTRGALSTDRMAYLPRDS